MDPKAGKKKNVSKLKPIEPKKDQAGKIKGNFAAEVLYELEQKDKNKKMNSEMKQLDKEINSFLQLNSTDLKNQMNDAFDGKKKDWREKYDQNQVKLNHEIQSKKAETLISKVAKKSNTSGTLAVKKRGTSKLKNENLEPILEEN